MTARTYDEFMERYNPDGTHPVIEVDAARIGGRETSPFIVVRHGPHAVIVNPLGFDDHLCIDLHPFTSGHDTVAGVMAMTGGRRRTLEETGETVYGYGWPGGAMVAVMVGQRDAT